MINLKNILEVIHFATEHGQKENRISNQYDKFVENIVKLLAFHQNDSTNKWIISVENVFRFINRQRIKRKTFKKEDTFKWLILDNGLDSKIIQNEIDSSSSNFKYKDIQRNNRPAIAILELISKIAKQILFEIELNKYSVTHTKKFLLIHVTKKEN